MTSILNRQNFLAHFPNCMLVASRFKDNKQWANNNINNISLEKAEILNWPKDKYDIYFTPNWELKNAISPNNPKWKSKKVAQSHWWNIFSFSIDTDEWTRPWESVWILPTIIVKTLRWYHMHFLLKTPVSIKEYLPRREQIQEKLVLIFKWDKKAKDIVRLLRVPGFIYWSDNIWETKIEVEQYNPDEIKNFEEREELFNNYYNSACLDDMIKQTIKKQFKLTTKKNITVVDLAFDDINKNISASDVLQDLYPRFEVRNPTTILESWRVTKWYKYEEHWNYMNNFSWDEMEDRPRWWPVKIASVFFNSWNKAFDYFAQKWWLNINEFRDLIWSAEKIVFEEKKTWDVTPYTQYWTSIEGIHIYDKWWPEKKTVWYLPEMMDIPFMDAIFVPIWFIENEWLSWWRQYIVRIEKQNWEEYVTIMPNCSSLKEFRKFMMNYWIMIPEKQRFYVHIMGFVYNHPNLKRYYQTNKLWLQIINWERIIIQKTWVYLMEEKNIFVNIEDESYWEVKSEDNNIDIKEVLGKVERWYEPRVSVTWLLTMILWANCFFFRESEIKVQLPQMFAIWGKESGKTSLLNLLFRAMGIDKDMSWASSLFVFEKHAKHYLPLHFSEFRNSAIKNMSWFEWFMRNLFDWTDNWKWLPSQKLNLYESNAMYCFDWQTIFGDSAARSRFVILATRKEHRRDIEELISLPNIYNFATSIFKDQDDFDEFAKKALVYKLSFIKNFKSQKFESERVFNNYWLLYALCDRLWVPEYKDILFESMKVQWMFTWEDDTSKIISTALNRVTQYGFDADIYRKWLVVYANEEGMRYNPWLVDLRSMIEVSNIDFLWENTLIWLETYIDLEKIYQKQSLWGSLFKALTRITFDRADYTAEELNTIRSLREFLKQNSPSHPMLPDINNDLYQTTKKWNITSQQKIEFD